mgnify:CR=1 FL=1|jgi:hypothetical protein
MNKQAFQDLYELLEDTLQYFCDENESTERMNWLAVEAIAKSKRIELGVTHPSD